MSMPAHGPSNRKPVNLPTSQVSDQCANLRNVNQARAIEDCINLQERFGKRYRVGWKATKGQWAREDWPWLMEIRCRYGIVYPVGGEILAVVTDRPRLGAKLRALPCVLSSRGDVETVITFHVDDIEAVLAVLKPYRRRQLSEAQKQQQAERLAAFRFGKSAAVQDTKTALESTQATANGPEAVPATEGSADVI
jgi:hypothetical protein